MSASPFLRMSADLARRLGAVRIEGPVLAIDPVILILAHDGSRWAWRADPVLIAEVRRGLLG